MEKFILDIDPGPCFATLGKKEREKKRKTDPQIGWDYKKKKRAFSWKKPWER